MDRDKIGTQTCYIHQCTKRYVDVHSMSVSQSCLSVHFYAIPILHFKFPKFFIYLCNKEVLQERPYYVATCQIFGKSHCACVVHLCSC